MLSHEHDNSIKLAILCNDKNLCIQGVTKSHNKWKIKINISQSCINYMDNKWFKIYLCLKCPKNNV